MTHHHSTLATIEQLNQEREMFRSSRNGLALSLLKRKRAQQRCLIKKSCESVLSNELSATQANQFRSFHKRHASSFQENIGTDAQNNPNGKFKSFPQALQTVRQLVASLDSSDGQQIESEKHVYDGVEDVLGNIVSQVDDGALNPLGKHGKNLSRFFEFILYAYSQVDIPGISSFDKCEQVLDTLKKWNLDIRSRHYEYAIISANREGRYKEAADLFLRQIDPEAGYNPISVSLDTPHGLVAIALWAQQEGQPVAEHVFDAVMKLTMVSPSDAKQYTLAAGTALGQAGEWESAINYLYDRDDVKQFGQPIISAVMRACLMCDRPDVALEAFDHSINNLGMIGGGEWQWGGGGDRMDSLCRDFAMRAMKGKKGTSERAVNFFQEVLDEDVTISIEALQGIVEACERDRDWETALGLLIYIIRNHHSRPNWIIDGSKQEIQELYSLDTKQPLDEPSWIPKLGPLVASVMRSCNADSKFGTAVFCLLLMGSIGSSVSAKTEGRSLKMKLTSYLSETEFNNDLLVATMTSLCGLRLYQSAIDVFETAERREKRTSLNAQGPRTGAAHSVYQYALLENSKHGTIEVGNPAIHAILEIERLIETSKSNDAQEQRKIIQANLADVMKACTYIRQSNLSFVMFNWVAMQMKGTKQEFSSLQNIANPVDLDDSFAMQSDSLLAEVVSARRWNSNTADSNNVFESLLRNNAIEVGDWVNSCNAGVSALLVKGDGDAAMKIFNALDNNAMNPDLFVIIADHLAKEQQWVEVWQLYNTAVKEGCYSEELSAIAMKAAVSSEVENRIIVLREMIQNVAQHNGTSSEKWLRERYWQLKGLVGFKYARLLMWWNDPSTCHLDELNFAIEEINEQTANGADVRFETIRTIINSAKRGFVQDNLDKYRWIPSSAGEWRELMQLVIYQAELTNHLDSRMIDELVRSYIALDCREDCIHFVMDSLQSGARVNKFALHQALEAAHLESSDAVDDLQMMLST